MDPDEFSGDSEFEESMGDFDAKKNTVYVNKPYDEAYELSGESSAPDTPSQRKMVKLTNDMYDEALEVSQSLDTRDGFGMSTGSPHSTQKVLNRPFDEAVDLSSQSEQDSEAEFPLDSSDMKDHYRAPVHAQQKAEFQSPSSPTPQVKMPSSQPTAQQYGQQSAQQSHQATQRPQVQFAATPSATHTTFKPKSSPSDGDNSDVSDDDDSEVPVEGAYNPKEYAHLNVSDEVRDLFQYIERYRPHEIELDTPLKCFIPEYIPAIGEMDAFLKMPRPDGQPDHLGLRVLDEPAAIQSDPTVLELHLKAVSKKQYGDVAVRSIEQAARNPAAITRWINSINDLHRTKPPPQVNIKHSMPEIDTLMETWPEDFEDALGNLELPSGDLELPLHDYVKLVCSIVDIPVYDDPIESLYTLFSLYTAFRDNQHFTGQQQQQQSFGMHNAGYDL